MNKKTIALTSLVVALLLAGGFYFFISGDDDAKIINEKLARVVELTEKEGNEAIFVTLGESREMMQFFAAAPRVDLGSPLPLITDREELEGIIVQIRQSIQSLSIRIVHNDLTVAEDGLTAQMELEAEGNGAYFGDSGRERRKFSIDWVKEEGDWMIEAVRHDGPLYKQ